jgi:hypothetical protein
MGKTVIWNDQAKAQLRAIAQNTVLLRAENQDGHVPTAHVLLVLDVPVVGEQYISPALHRRQ